MVANGCNADVHVAEEELVSCAFCSYALTTHFHASSLLYSALVFLYQSLCIVLCFNDFVSQCKFCLMGAIKGYNLLQYAVSINVQ